MMIFFFPWKHDLRRESLYGKQYLFRSLKGLKDTYQFSRLFDTFFKVLREMEEPQKLQIKLKLLNNCNDMKQIYVVS